MSFDHAHRNQVLNTPSPLFLLYSCMPTSCLSCVLATATFFDLPLEIREEVYRLACLPEPAIYCLNGSDIYELPRAARALKPNKRSNNKWQVIKRKYPTATHLCRESRNYVLQLQRREDARAARLGVEALDYQIGQAQRAFESQIDIVFVYSWRLLYALDRHVFSTFPFPESFLDVEHIALDAQALTYEGRWLPFYHILWRFAKLRNLSIVFQGCRAFAETRSLSLPARMEDYGVEEDFEEQLVCEHVEADLTVPRLIDDNARYSNQLWSPTTQLVAMVLGAGQRIKVSASQLVVSHSSCHAKEQGSELGAYTESPDYALLFERDVDGCEWWIEELQERCGMTQNDEKTQGLFANMLKMLPCKWAVLTPLYYIFLLWYFTYF